MTTAHNLNHDFRIGHRLVDHPDVFGDDQGQQWIFPTDYTDADAERHDLPSLKGATDTELPTLDTITTSPMENH